MADRQKVIEGLKELSLEAYGRWVHCQYTQDELINGIKDYVDDAIELLENPEQIADDMENVISELSWLKEHYAFDTSELRTIDNAIALLKKKDDTLGIRQTADSITFISTGTARQGEERGIMLGKAMMHEWLEKELLYRGLLTDEIRSVFKDAELK